MFILLYQIYFGNFLLMNFNHFRTRPTVDENKEAKSNHTKLNLPLYFRITIPVGEKFLTIQIFLNKIKIAPLFPKFHSRRGKFFDYQIFRQKKTLPFQIVFLRRFKGFLFLNDINHTIN